ncbi:MAG: hypothetical protein QM793_06785 [Muricomes sp.]
MKEKLEEKKAESENKTWELWLHKVFDKSYAEFKAEAQQAFKAKSDAVSMAKVDVQKAAMVALNTVKLLSSGGDADEPI